jgi:choice-of-anchor B domain-containing protein
MKNLLLVGFLLIYCILINAQISPTQNIQFRSHLNLGNNCANVWGYAANGREYALAGTFNGMAIVDVTNPDALKLIKNVVAVQSSWREIKTYKNFAYISTEGSGQGLQIVNLASLPDSNVAIKNYKGGDSTLVSIERIHALHVDTAKGFIYLYGGRSKVKVGLDTLLVSGAVVLDIKKDPWNPKFVGVYEKGYIHDGVAVNDTLYGGHIYEGYFSVIDFRDKKNYKVLGTQKTPTAFTHNTWLSDSHKTVFTTDENAGSYLAAYDITDLSNIKSLDRIRSVAGPNAIVHNTYILNNYAINSWYTEGVTIVDAHRPQNLIQVGQNDTYNGSGAEFKGAWGVYPFLPSGTLLVNNINDGLRTLTPKYVRACYLEGNAIDSATRQPLSGVRVKINSTDPDKMAESNISGNYYSGQATPGDFTVTYSKSGYYPRTVNVILVAGELFKQNIQLRPKVKFSVTGNVVANVGGAKIPNSVASFKGSDTTYVVKTDAQGNFVVNEIYDDTYEVVGAAWGYLHKKINFTVNPNNTNVAIKLDKGYQDDFVGDLGWKVSGTFGDTSKTKGVWKWGTPIETNLNGIIASPGSEMPNDFGNACYVTGNNSSEIGVDDVDDGFTLLTSPIMKLRSYQNPKLFLSYWFVNIGGSTVTNDTMKIILSNGLKDTVLTTITQSNSSWLSLVKNLKSVLPLTDSMQIKIWIADSSPGHILEGGIDAFRIDDAVSTTEIQENWTIKAYPNPFNSTLNVDFQLDKYIKNAQLKIFNIMGQVLAVKKMENTVDVGNPDAFGKGVVSLNENLEAGIYFIRLEADNKVSRTIRVVKQ